MTLKELFPNAIPLPADRKVNHPYEYCVLGAVARFVNRQAGVGPTLEVVDLESFPMCGRIYRYLRAIFSLKEDRADAIGNLVIGIQRANDNGEIDKAYELAEELLDVCKQAGNRKSDQASGASPKSVGNYLPTR